jgi:hypothetical protein
MTYPPRRFWRPSRVSRSRIHDAPVLNPPRRRLQSEVISPRRLVTVHLPVLLCVFSMASCQNSTRVSGQPPSSWARTYGGLNDDVPSSIRQTSDGGYIVAGTTRSFGVGGSDGWVLKLKADGDLTWPVTYGGKAPGPFADDRVNSISLTSFGNYLVAGSTESTLSAYTRSWILHLDKSGGSGLQYYYTSDLGDFQYANSIQETLDGGLIAAGAAGGIALVFKIPPSGLPGEVAWMKGYGATSTFPYDRANSIQQTSDGGYIIAGISGGAPWVFKLFANGNIAWQKKYGTGSGAANSIQQTSDGGYIVAGVSAGVAWVSKLFANGDIAWQKRYGGPGTGAGSGAANSIQQTSDGGYIVAGGANFFDGLLQYAWVSKLNPSGFQVWQKRYGGQANDVAFSVQQTSDGGYIAAGATSSFGEGGSDFFVLKFDSHGNNCASARALGNGVSTSLSVTTPTAPFSRRQSRRDSSCPAQHLPFRNSQKAVPVAKQAPAKNWCGDLRLSCRLAKRGPPNNNYFAAW